MRRKNAPKSSLAEQATEAAPAFVAVYTVSTGKYLYVNDNIRIILGYEKEVFFEKGLPSASLMLHPEDLARIVKESKAAIRNANKIENRKEKSQLLATFEYRLKHQDGSWRWIHTNESVFSRDKRGKVENIVSISVDVTARKEAELQAEEKLRQSEERYRLVVEYSRDVILALDMQGRITYASPANEKIFGYTQEESMGTSAFDNVHPDDKEYMLKAFADIMNSIGKTFTYRFRHKDGHYVTVEGSGSLVYDEEKNPYMIVGTVRDITQRMKLEKQKDAFMGIASHELKTPVTSLKAYAQVLQKRFSKAGDSQSAAFLAKMDGQLGKLTNLINDLLDVTKVETGKLKFKKEQFDFNELVHETIEEMQRTTEKHIIVKKLGTSKVLHGDRDRIGQVIINLLTNAIKYSPNAGNIIVRTRVGKKHITMTVQDFGMGIAPENLKKVFERFYRGTEKTEETYPGLGLGLYISSEIVNRHGGKIAVKSQQGEGTTFTFSLPHTA